MSEHDDTRSNAAKSTKAKIKSLGHETKQKTKTFLRKQKLSPEERGAEDEDHNPYGTIQNDPAFDPSQLIGHKDNSIGGTPNRIAGSLYSGLKAVVNPRNAIKRKAATKVAIQDRPYVSRKADMEFLEAHDDLEKANSAADQEAVEEQSDRIEKLEGLRQSRKVAWTTSRHIKRVLVCPKREFPPPKKDDFYIVDSSTGRRRLDWKSWLQARNHNALKNFAYNRMGSVDYAGQPPFDREVTSRYMERVLIASSPWQSWFLSLRSLYRWEDPAKTKKWFAIWFIIWYLDFVVTFILAFIAFKVLRNRFQQKEVESMRDSYERSLDKGTAAFRFNELIHKHGTDKWIDPVVETVGPVLQLQLSDLADTLEALNNFYDWRRPETTWATLFWFLCAILIGALAPTGYTMKIIHLYTIGSFFLSRPVASLHPEYRHVVNAFKWIFWNHPNDADWAMMYLREKAQETRASLIEQKVEEEYDWNMSNSAGRAYVGSLDLATATTTTSAGERDLSSDSDSDDGASFHTVESSTSILGGLDILSFRCSTHGLPGRLIIFSDGLRFERTPPIAAMRKEEWRHLWSELVEMRKSNYSTIAKVMTTEGLHLSFLDGSEVKLEHVRRRDRAFNCILGFSGLRFQVLQPVAAAEVQEKSLGNDDKEFDE